LQKRVRYLHLHERCHLFHTHFLILPRPYIHLLKIIKFGEDCNAKLSKREGKGIHIQGQLTVLDSLKVSSESQIEKVHIVEDTPLP
jgi:hypothetical protein